MATAEVNVTILPLKPSFYWKEVRIRNEWRKCVLTEMLTQNAAGLMVFLKIILLTTSEAIKVLLEQGKKTKLPVSSCFHIYG